MRSQTAIIAEDEPQLRAELREALAAVWPELVVVAEASDGLQATTALERHLPDVLFLDIEMPGRSGLEVARHASERCHVVFVTAFDCYAVAAFEQGAVDYVLKPFGPERLAATVRRLRKRLAEAPPNIDTLLTALTERLQPPRDAIRWITAVRGDELQLITVDEVCYFQAGDGFTKVHTASGEFRIRRTIRDLAEDLDPGMFWQIHRGTIVNVNSIAGVSRDFRRRLRVRLKQRPEQLPVSDPFVHRFAQM